LGLNHPFFKAYYNVILNEIQEDESEASNLKDRIIKEVIDSKN